VQTIETQFRQYHVTKVGGARHICEPHDHKSGGGLEPLGPIGVYAYAIVTYMFRGMCVVNACVCLLDSTLSCATTAEPIEIPFRTWTRVGPRNHELCGGPDPQGKGQFFWGGASPSP